MTVRQNRNQFMRTSNPEEVEDSEVIDYVQRFDINSYPSVDEFIQSVVDITQLRKDNYFRSAYLNQSKNGSYYKPQNVVFGFTCFKSETLMSAKVKFRTNADIFSSLEMLNIQLLFKNLNDNYE